MIYSISLFSLFAMYDNARKSGAYMRGVPGHHYHEKPEVSPLIASLSYRPRVRRGDMEMKGRKLL